MPAALYILFGASFTAAVCVAAGQLLLRVLKVSLDRYERLLFGFLLGAAVLSNLTFVLCATQLARKGVFLAAGLGVLFSWWRSRQPRVGGSGSGLSQVSVRLFGNAVAHSPGRARAGASLAAEAGGDSPGSALRRQEWRRGTHECVRHRFLASVDAARTSACAIAAAYTILYFFNAMAPEISPDGSAYHLGLVARYLREHGFHRITTNMYANLSQGVEMLFLFAFAFGRHSAAAMVHFAFLLALPAAMVLYARRIGRLPAGICGALFVFASPLIGIDGISAYIDVAVATIVFGLFYLLQIWDAERQPGLLVAAGLLAGFAYAAKYTAGLAVPYAVAFVTSKSWRGRKTVLRPALTVALCAGAVMLPWMLKNYAWLENPFSPFLNAVFPNPYVHAGYEREYSREMRHDESVHSYAELPWAVTVDGRLAGFFGPLFLLAPVGLLAARRREGRHLLLAAAVFGATYFFNIGARFLIPALPFVALAMALVFVRWRALAIALVGAHAILSWPGITSLYCRPTAWRLRQIPVRAALRLEQEDSFLDANLSTYRMARLIERAVPPGATVFAPNQVAESYTTRRILVKDQAASNQVLGDILWTPLHQPFEPSWLLEFRFAPASLRRIRVAQTARSDFDKWSISELRVYRGETELPRDSRWRLRAEPNPWEVQLAFDNTPVTRWQTWLPLDGREFVAVDFGRAETIDRVGIQCTRDQYKIRLKLEGMDTSGRWRPLADAVPRDEPLPVAQLRRMATEELKLRGVDYLLIYRADFGMDDFRSHPFAWGLTPVGIMGEDRLYRIDDLTPPAPLPR